MIETELRANTEQPAVAVSPALRRWSSLLALVWLVVAGFLLFSVSPGGAADYSSLGHFLLFGAIAVANIAVALTFATDSVSEMRAIWIAALVSGVLAVITEAVQHLLPTRAFETADLAFDATGIGVAALVVLGLLLVLSRPNLIEFLVGSGIVGLALLGVAIFVLATQPVPVLDGGCPAAGGEQRPGSEMRLVLTEPTEQGGCVAIDDGWMTPMLGAVSWSSDHDAVEFLAGGLRSPAQPELADAIRTSGEFTLAIRMRPKDLFANPTTRWILEVVAPDRPGRPLVRLLHAGRQIRSDVNAGNQPGDVAMLAAAGGLTGDEWTEVVVIVDDEWHQMFVDGELQGSLRRDAQELAAEDDVAIVLGLRKINPENNFRGQMSDVIILPRAIDPDEIDELFDQ